MKVTLAHWWTDTEGIERKPGDTVDVDDETAKQLTHDGFVATDPENAEATQQATTTPGTSGTTTKGSET